MTENDPYEPLLDTIETYRCDGYEIERIRVPQQFFDALVSDGNFVRPECDDTKAPDDPNVAQVAGYEVVADDVYSIVVDVATETQVEFADDATLTVELDGGETLEYSITDASFESNGNVYDDYPGIVTNTDTTRVTDYTGSFTVNVEECNKEAYLELFGIDESDVDERFEQGESTDSAWTLEELVEACGSGHSSNELTEPISQDEDIRAYLKSLDDGSDDAFESQLDTPHIEPFEHTERFEPTNDIHDAKYATDPEQIEAQLADQHVPFGEAAVVYVNILELQELFMTDDFQRVADDDDIEIHANDAIGLFNGAEVVHDSGLKSATVDTVSTR